MCGEGVRVWGVRCEGVRCEVRVCEGVGVRREVRVRGVRG